MFHFPGFPPPGLTTRQSSTLTSACGCPIRISSDQSSLAAPRGISSPATSFIGSCRLGIHRVPFLPYPINLTFAPDRTTHPNGQWSRPKRNNRRAAEIACISKRKSGSLSWQIATRILLYSTLFNCQRTQDSSQTCKPQAGQTTLENWIAEINQTSREKGALCLDMHREAPAGNLSTVALVQPEGCLTELPRHSPRS